VREHGFSTNRGARGLSSGRTGIVGLTLPLVNDAYFGPILGGASEALYELDMRILLAPTLHEHDREVSLMERLVRGTTDGAILILPRSRPRSWSASRSSATRSSSSTRASIRPRASLRLRDARRRREARDRASARAWSPPDRHRHRADRLVRERRAAGTGSGLRWRRPGCCFSRS
jgi:Transcriptional regulators